MFYLMKIYVLRGGGELVGAMLRSFWWSEGCLEAFWELEAMRLDIGGFEAGKWEAGGWKMWAQNKRTGGGPWYPASVLAARGEDIQVGGKQETGKLYKEQGNGEQGNREQGNREQGNR